MLVITRGYHQFWNPPQKKQRDIWGPGPGGYEAGEPELKLPEGCIIGDVAEGCVEYWATPCDLAMRTGGETSETQR